MWHVRLDFKIALALNNSCTAPQHLVRRLRVISVLRFRIQKWKNQLRALSSANSCKVGQTFQLGVQFQLEGSQFRWVANQVIQ